MNQQVEDLRERLRAFSGRYPEVARDADLSIDWVRQFASGRYTDIKLSSATKLQNWLEANEPAEGL